MRSDVYFVVKLIFHSARVSHTIHLWQRRQFFGVWILAMGREVNCWGDFLYWRRISLNCITFQFCRWHTWGGVGYRVVVQLNRRGSQHCYITLFGERMAETRYFMCARKPTRSLPATRRQNQQASHGLAWKCLYTPTVLSGRFWPVRYAKLTWF